MFGGEGNWSKKTCAWGRERGVTYCSMGVIFKNRGDLELTITCYERYSMYLELDLLFLNQVFQVFCLMINLHFVPGV